MLTLKAIWDCELSALVSIENRAEIEVASKSKGRGFRWLIKMMRAGRITFVDNGFNLLDTVFEGESRS